MIDKRVTIILGTITHRFDTSTPTAFNIEFMLLEGKTEFISINDEQTGNAFHARCSSINLLKIEPLQ